MGISTRSGLWRPSETRETCPSVPLLSKATVFCATRLKGFLSADSTFLPGVSAALQCSSAERTDLKQLVKIFSSSTDNEGAAAAGSALITPGLRFRRELLSVLGQSALAAVTSRRCSVSSRNAEAEVSAWKLSWEEDHLEETNMWPNQGPPYAGPPAIQPPNPAFPAPPNPAYPAMPIPSYPPGPNPVYPPGMNQPSAMPYSTPYQHPFPPAVTAPHAPFPAAGHPCPVPQYGGPPAGIGAPGHKKHKKMKKMKKGHKAHKEHKHMKHGKHSSSSSSSSSSD
ncbi:homeobox protein Hox-A3-like [Sinocyclocheilus anshuiensis]|uniref:homeobox protein Hox-A3-like n=1 Tax=Sinocyclocheilus anshuiensis TaxID=1608454 RepID=UPI0007B8DCD1|nr:PREDICTED: homeobox protein Hox-A3-like [Sinocyclocheilus anshuiensis]